MSTTRQFDLLILGSGSTAFAAAIRAAELGYSAAMTEVRTVGGTCVNRGCVPSKNLIKAAEVYHTARHPRFPGLRLEQKGLDFASLVLQKDELILDLRQKKYLSIAGGDTNIEIFQGRASLFDANTIDVDSARLRGEQVLIATGGSPLIPPIDGLSSVPYLTSDLLTSEEHIELTDLPKSLVIIGGGYIAVELGQMFVRFGVEVTILERGPRLLSGFEPEIGDELGRILAGEGVKVLTGTLARRVQAEGSGVAVLAEGSDGPGEFRAEKLLVAAGRTPNTADLGLDKVGVDIDKLRFIKVDEYLRTSIPHIWAAGDVTGGPMATPVGAHDGVIVADNALREAARRVDYASVPRAVFTDPQIATVGLTDEQAQARGLACECRVVEMSQIPRAAAVWKTEGLIKMVAEQRSGRLVGVHMLGESAAEVIHEAALAIRFGATIDDLIDQVHVYPTMAEAIKVAALAFRKDISRLSCCAE